METLTIIIAAGETKQYNTGGQYIEVLEAVSDMDITLYGPSGAVETSRGAQAGTWMKEAFTWFSVKSAVAQTIRMLVTGREGGSRRYSGQVSITGGVLDADPDVVAASGAAYQGVVQQNGVAASHSHLQLWNASADKTLFVESVLVHSSSACLVSFQADGAAAANAAPAAQTANKLTSAADSAAAQLRHDFPGAHVDGYRWVQLIAGESYRVHFDTPIAVAPGTGLGLSSNVANTMLRATFDWREK